MTEIPNFHTIDQMLDQCDAINAKEWVIGTDRWYYVVPAKPGELAHISFMQGGRAIEARARHDGSWEARWHPEPGETEWIGRAVAEYRRRWPENDVLADPLAKKHFSETMARWSAAKPWLERTDAA